MLKKLIKHFVNPNEIGNKKYNFIEKVIKTEEIMHLIKKDMNTVLKLSRDFWKEFKHFNMAEFNSFKKTLETIIDIKINLREKWKMLERYITHNTFYSAYYRWFLKDFLNQRVSSNDEYLRAFDTDNN